MNHSSYELHVNGLPTKEGEIPVKTLQALLAHTVECAARGLRLRIEGTSVKSGPTPAWLAKAMDLTFTGLGTGCTKLVVDAPHLGDVLGGEWRDADLFLPPPDPRDTALSILAHTLRDTMVENSESDYFDQGVLKSLLDFRPFFRNFANSVELVPLDRPIEAVVFGLGEIEKAEKLSRQTPEARAFVISGTLESISHRQKRFLLELTDGQKLPGRIHEEFLNAEELRNFWGHKVTIKGVVHFRPSGRVQLLEAHSLLARGTGDEVFDLMPRAEESGELFEMPANKSHAFAGVRGMWPGDETIEELLAALRD